MMRPLALHFGVTVLALSATSALADSYAQTILADNPLAYFRLEEQPGEGTAVDSSSTGAYAGTYVYSMDGLYPKMGQPGIDTNSVYFRSYTDDAGTQETSYVEIPFAEQLNPNGPFSAECWVRAMSASDTATRAPFGSFEGWVTDAPGWFFYQTANSSASSPSCWAWVMKGGGIWIQAGAIKMGQWYHLAASYDGTKVSFYVDGALVGTSDVPGYVPTSTKSTYIGAIPPGGWLFDGSVDEAAIYGTALTAEQIHVHYQVGLTNFRAAEIPAEITQNPVAATAYAGREVKFTVGADGTAPLLYQWYKGESLIPDATNDVLTFTCAYEDNGTTYKAKVTNAFGTAMSTEATLTVTTDLEISAQPIAITRNIGSKAALRVGTKGALPVSFQWYKGTTAIDGATNAMLWLPKLTAADDASTFHVRVTNPWNTIDSDEVSLTVTPRAVEVPITGYAKIVMADDPVAYWRLDEPADSTTAVDAAGSFDGTYEPGTGTLTYAVATGIPGETNPAVAVKDKARVRVPYALELNPYGAFTAEAWVKPNTLGVNGQDYRTAFSSMGSGPTGWLVYQQPDNTWAWVIFADNWVSTWLYDTTDTVAANTWYHIVLTREGSLFSFYVNGKLVASTEYDIYNPSRDGKTDFGWRNDDGWNPFDGTIDDVAFYNKALTAVQVLNHYQTSVKMSIQKDGNNVILTWPAGKLQQCDTVNGTYTDIDSATSPYSVAIGQGSKFFRIKL